MSKQRRTKVRAGSNVPPDCASDTEDTAITANRIIDQAMFAAEKTLDTLGTRGLRSVFEKLPFEQRVTHPGTHGFPDATFDYFFGKNVLIGKPMITKTNASDHLPVTCDVTIQ